jgi:putative radical SAM enzyme (TIGR03279 family)
VGTNWIIGTQTSRLTDTACRFRLFGIKDPSRSRTDLKGLRPRGGPASGHRPRPLSWAVMSLPRVVAVTDGSPAARAGLLPGDQIVAMDGQLPRDVIEYQLLADQERLELDLRRGGLELTATVERGGGEPLGVEIDAPLFDRVRTCDNHCEFCFIHQLPKGLRKSLYVRDDDYRLSFLYGNFTTLTRFTEIDLERVVNEGLSPLWVSIHATDPDVRSRMLRNRRGAVSLRWLRALLDNGITVHGQVVVCPGVNDGAVLDDTLAGVMDRFPELASVACVPLGVSRWNSETAMRPHSRMEAAAVVDLVEDWQESFLSALGQRTVYASDEYYLLAERPLPALGTYGDLAQHENGVGMFRGFEARFHGREDAPAGGPGGFFQSVDGAPAAGYRAPRERERVLLRPRKGAPVTVLTGDYGRRILAPLVASERPDAEVVAVPNEYFGGNIAVAGLITGIDLARFLGSADPRRRYLLPDVCLSQGRFIDGMSPDDLPLAVEVVPADGAALRRALA